MANPASTATEPTVHAVTTTVSIPPATAYPHATTFHLTHRDGYTAEATLRRGELVKTSSIRESLAPCKVKPDVDAAIPFELRLTKTTPDFSSSPSIRLSMDGTGSFWHGQELKLPRFLGHLPFAACREEGVRSASSVSGGVQAASDADGPRW